jgi:hypothetical protein
VSGRERERALDLLADRATQALDSGEQAELDRLLGEHPELDDDSLDLAAAAAALAFERPAGPMPAHLRERVEADGRAFFGPERTAPAAGVLVSPKRAEWLSSTGLSWTGWLAAAACIVLAAVAWWPRAEPAPPAPIPAPTLAEMRERLKADRGVVVASWEGPKGPATGVEGDVVWSDAEQRGYMRFRGLAPNDPSRQQYQLWIFSANQEEKYPVDGGVFDVSAPDGDVIVPIDAKIRVEDPKLFAVTIEKPGGVVVSKRDRLVALAKIS